MHAPPGNRPPSVRGGGTPACWRFVFNVDPSRNYVTFSTPGKNVLLRFTYCVAAFPVFIRIVRLENAAINELTFFD